MPVIHVEFDNERVTEIDVRSLCEATKLIVQEVTGIEDVFVYGNSAQVKVNIHPVKIFVEMSAHKIADTNVLIRQIKDRLTQWKQENAFPHLINLTLDPKPWKIEIGI